MRDRQTWCEGQTDRQTDMVCGTDRHGVRDRQTDRQTWCEGQTIRHGVWYRQTDMV